MDEPRTPKVGSMVVVLNNLAALDSRDRVWLQDRGMAALTGDVAIVTRVVSQAPVAYLDVLRTGLSTVAYFKGISVIGEED